MSRRTTPIISETGSPVDSAQGNANPVLEVIRERLVTGSRPGLRQDSHRVVLAIEGGASRAAFASGMALAIDELEILPCFDAVYGSSAGAWIGAWLLSGSAGLGLDPNQWGSASARWVKPGRALLPGPVIDTERLMKVWRDLVPTFFENILTQRVPLHPLATDVVTGRSVDLVPYIRDENTLRLALRATAAMPVLTGPPVELGRRSWLDGGIVEHVPFVTPAQDGATHILLLRNHRAGRQVTDSSPRQSFVARLEDRMVQRYLDRRAPGVLSGWSDRRQRIMDQERALAEVGSAFGSCSIWQLRPPADGPRISPMQRDTRPLHEALKIGRSTALDAFADTSKVRS